MTAKPSFIRVKEIQQRVESAEPELTFYRGQKPSNEPTSEALKRLQKKIRR